MSVSLTQEVLSKTILAPPLSELRALEVQWGCAAHWHSPLLYYFCFNDFLKLGQELWLLNHPVPPPAPSLIHTFFLFKRDGGKMDRNFGACFWWPWSFGGECVLVLCFEFSFLNSARKEWDGVKPVAWELGWWTSNSGLTSYQLCDLGRGRLILAYRIGWGSTGRKGNAFFRVDNLIASKKN